MRIHIKTTPNKDLVPYNYQPKLVGILHKWLGTNELHGKPAPYSFSWLLNAKPNKEGLDYPNGAKIFISFYDDNYLKQVVKAIINDPAMCYGMKATDVTIQDNPDLTNQTLFQCASPIFIQRYIENGKTVHYTYESENAGELLTETLNHKIQLAGLSVDESLRVSFDPSASSARTRIIEYRGIKNKVSQCPVIIEGKPETKIFAWNVGLGSSTGIGFGAIY